MRLNKLINHFLGYFGLVLVRQTTINTLSASVLLEPLQEQVHKDSEDQKQLLRHQISVKWDLIDLFDKQRLADVELTCPLCEFQGDAVLFSRFETGCIFEGGTLIRHQCPQCDLIFGAQKMLSLSDAELSRDYEWHYQIFSEGDSTAQELRAFHALKPEKDRMYLNWGSGAWSNTLDVLRQEGWNVYGYEPHSSATASNTYIISSLDRLSTMRFDGIFSNNVLEHLRYPVRELKVMRSLLKSDGKMSHATPCFEYLYEFTRFHLFFFLGRSRTQLASQAELKIADFVVDGEFMNIILTKD
jgi:hypothetical protein